MTQKPRLAWRLLAAALLASALATASETPCRELDDSASATLITYVQRKFNLPETNAVKLTELSNDDCYRKLQFASADPRNPFKVALYASPDLRYLTHELLDTKLDPAEEGRRQKQVVLTKLAAADRGPLRGAVDAPVTITIFSDFQCPFCSAAAKGITHNLIPDDPSVRMEFHYFPLAMHAWAKPAAEAAACARKQGDSYFWAMHDYFFEHQRELKPDTLRAAVLDFAQSVEGLNLDDLKVCIERRMTAAEVTRDVTLGRDLGVTGTPTMFVGGETVVGYRPDDIRALADRAAGAASKGEPKRR